MFPIDITNNVYKTHRQYNQDLDKLSDRLAKILEFFLIAIIFFILFCIFVNEKNNYK